MLTINDIQSRMRAAGSHWFDADTMKFWGTRIESGVWTSADGSVAYFVTSDEQFDHTRGFTIRRYDVAANEIHTEGELATWTDLHEAKLHAKHAAARHWPARSCAGSWNSATRPFATHPQAKLRTPG